MSAQTKRGSRGVVLLAVSIGLSMMNANARGVEAPAKTAAEANDPALERELRKFLASTKGTYGWAPAKGEISYDFFPDGRVHIQGPDGEATMWEGKWTLRGSQLTIVNDDTKQKKTVTAVRAGNELRLNGELYRRYRPE